MVACGATFSVTASQEGLTEVEEGAIDLVNVKDLIFDKIGDDGVKGFAG
jgi:hypothetical protein